LGKVDAPGLPGVLDGPDASTDEPLLALAASTMAVIRPAKASNPNNANISGLQHVFSAAGAATGGGGITLLLV